MQAESNQWRMQQGNQAVCKNIPLILQISNQKEESKNVRKSGKKQQESLQLQKQERKQEKTRIEVRVQECKQI